MSSLAVVVPAMVGGWVGGVGAGGMVGGGGGWWEVWHASACQLDDPIEGGSAIKSLIQFVYTTRYRASASQLLTDRQSAICRW